MDHVVGSPPCVVPDLVAGVAKADRPVAVVARALAGEAQGDGGLMKYRSVRYISGQIFYPISPINCSYICVLPHRMRC